MKLNKGHYLEITDRIHVEQCNIETNLIDHPVIVKNKKLRKQIEAAQAILGKVYQKVGKKA